MSYQGKNFTTSGSEPAAFEEQTDGTLTQAVKIDNGQVCVSAALLGSVAIEDGSTTTILISTGHSALVGNLLLDGSGITRGQLRTVSEITTDTITLSVPLLTVPNAGDDFNLYMPTILQTDGNGFLVLSSGISVTQGDGGGGNDPWTVSVTNAVVIDTTNSGVFRTSGLPSSGYVTTAISNSVASDLATAVTTYLAASANFFDSIGYAWDGTNFNAFIIEITP